MPKRASHFTLARNRSLGVESKGERGFLQICHCIDKKTGTASLCNEGAIPCFRVVTCVLLAGLFRVGAPSGALFSLHTSAVEPSVLSLGTPSDSHPKANTRHKCVNVHPRLNA